MQTITDQAIADQLIARINSLDNYTQPQWGKMTVYQMLRHLVLWEEMAIGNTLYKQSFLGRLIGKVALKDMMKEQPVKPNLPTIPGFKITSEGDADAEKNKLIRLIKEHAGLRNKGFLHPFFGQLTPEQAGFMAWKHADHHLRQFGV